MTTPSTGRKYSDGTPVPFPLYRCPSAAKSAHPCKLTVDHEADHKCVCGKKWKKVAG